MALEQALATATQPVLLALHYPPISADGAPYDPYLHGLENVAALLEVLDQAPTAPCLIAAGHIHRAFLADLALPSGRRIPVSVAGSSGYAERAHRAGTFAVYELAARTVSRVLYRVEGGVFRPAAER